MLVDQYHNVLAKLTRSIEAHLESNPEAGFDQSLEDVELVIEWWEAVHVWTTITIKSLI